VSDGAFNAVADLALAATTLWPNDIRAVIEGETFDPPPWNVVLGPVRPRGSPAGAVLVDGRRVAEWGPTDHTDMAFSVTKSYIGLLAAAALDRGLIPGFDAPVSASVRDPAFASPLNRTVTWRQLLDQTSEWEGSTFGIPDTVDRDRQLAPTDDPTRFNRATPRHVPGSYWDYNDARVNALCLALTRAFGRGLPDVLADLHPAFADRTGWAWDGYGAQSTIDLGHARVEVAVGGGHWGGGLSATVDHHLALGVTIRDRGLWQGQRIVSDAALDALLAPCPLQPVYGGLWWLNTGRRLFPAAPEDSILAMGVGATILWVSRSAGVVACLRWVRPEAVNEVLAAILRGMEDGACATSAP
jgi:CubicO group peptidase (beta-lactamase class C family)